MLLERRFKNFVKILVDNLFPNGIQINTNDVLNVKFKLSSRFWGYKNFANSSHNPLWVQCIKDVKGKVFFDIGAHVGLYTIPASMLAKKVVAFEPSLQNLKSLHKHISLNNVENIVTVEPVAVSDKVGFIDFHESDFETHPKNSILKTHEFGKKRSVPTITIDDYCQKHKIIPEVMKIDIEGAEFFALMGAKNTLVEYKPLIFLSLHPRELKELGYSLDWLTTFAKEINYKIIPEDYDSILRLQEVIMESNSK